MQLRFFKGKNIVKQCLWQECLFQQKTEMDEEDEVDEGEVAQGENIEGSLEKSVEKSDAPSSAPSANVTINGPQEEEGEDGATSSQTVTSPPPNGNSPGVGDTGTSGTEIRKRNVQPYTYEWVFYPLQYQFMNDKSPLDITSIIFPWDGKGYLSTAIVHCFPTLQIKDFPVVLTTNSHHSNL